MESARVRVATCHNGAEVALLRSLLSAHGIHVHIAGEHHASMLGGLAGAMIQLDVWVDREDADEASALIGSMRDGSGEVAPGDDDEDDDDDLADTSSITGRDIDLSEELDPAVPDPQEAIERRRRTGVVLLLACCVTFGTAHLYTRAWMRGITLAAIEIVALAQLGPAPVVGALMLAGAVITDLTGSVIRVQRGFRRKPLPKARLLN